MSTLALCCCIAACSDQAPPEAAAPVERPSGLTGADRDQFGCITSAGYRWCGMKLACVRPAELAKQEGFENTEAGYLKFCENRTLREDG